MLRGIKSSPSSTLILLLIIQCIINIWQAGHTQLHFDEAYYWAFSRILDLGYFDHPPMIAFLIRLGSYINESELGVRFFVTILQPISFWLLWTIIRRDHYGSQQAITYFLLTLSLPLLQMVGFIATPDAPLLFFTTIFLVTLKRFLSNNSLLWTFAVGVSMALLAYTKYHGALIVIFALIANPSLLKRPQSWLAAAIAGLLILPHLSWQLDNDFVSFKYHLSDRNRSFKPSYLMEYIANVFACLNPLLVPLLFFKRDSIIRESSIDRTIRVIGVGFLIFFAFSAFRGHVQPQWIIPASFWVINSILQRSFNSERINRYIVRACIVSFALMIVVRIWLVYSPFGYVIPGFGHKADRAMIDSLANGRPVVINSSYSRAALYSFYQRKQSNSQQSITHRSSQYQLWDIDKAWYGKRVLIESNQADSSIILPSGRVFKYTGTDFYIPTHKVTVNWSNSIKEIPSNQKAIWNLRISNPYSFPLHLADAKESRVQLKMVVMSGRDIVLEHVMSSSSLDVQPRKSVSAQFEVGPFNIPKGEYKVGFVIESYPMCFWWANSETYEILII
ncbi:MAG: ArnT family glycosyltransferase [Bacteroidales bacterium]